MTSETLISPPGKDEWIRSQRDSLAKIFHHLENARGLMGNNQDYGEKSSVQSMLFDPDWCSLKTPHVSVPVAGTCSFGNLWREDIPGETELLPRLMSWPPIKESGGGFLLPTLMARDGSGGPSMCGPGLGGLGWG